MAFAGIANAKDRADLVAYLKTKTAWARCFSAKKQGWGAREYREVTANSASSCRERMTLKYAAASI